jgi:transcriptional regulator with XRE-family HTH domain
VDEPSASFSRQEMGRRIKRRRDDLQLLQRDVASRIGMHPTSYSSLERGAKTLIQPEQLARLVDVLETTADYLLQRSEERGEIPNLLCQGVQVGVTQMLGSPLLTVAEAP